MRESLPTDPMELLARYKNALEKIVHAACYAKEEHPELLRANKLHVYIWQLAEDALNGKPICPGG